MVGASRPEKLDRLIENVARGERELASIHDAKLREAVRVALRIHMNAQSGLDALARERMRSRVLGSLRPRRPTFADRALVAFEVLAKPAPYAVRVIAIGALCIATIAGATVAGADTLPDDPLYSLKLAGEDLRLTFALSANDRASVQLSIAEHRLAEAEALATNGRDEDALVASSTYSQQIAEAAAELAELELHKPACALFGAECGRIATKHGELDAGGTIGGDFRAAEFPAHAINDANGKLDHIAARDLKRYLRFDGERLHGFDVVDAGAEHAVPSEAVGQDSE